jgi:hypothetical protein
MFLEEAKPNEGRQVSGCWGGEKGLLRRELFWGVKQFCVLMLVVDTFAKIHQSRFKEVQFYAFLKLILKNQSQRQSKHRVSVSHSCYCC